MPRQTSRRPERDDLTGEHALTDIGQLILLVLFAGAWIADTFFLRITTGLNALIPLWVRVPIGAVLLALAAYLGTSSYRIIFGTTRDKPHVVRTGVFSKVRHPMYLSEILSYLGLLLFSLSAIAAGVWLVAIAFLTYVSGTEERRLLARFGDDYARYMREVGMWIPRPRRR